MHRFITDQYDKDTLTINTGRTLFLQLAVLPAIMLWIFVRLFMDLGFVNPLVYASIAVTGLLGRQAGLVLRATKQYNMPTKGSKDESATKEPPKE
jgi:hypothetical protein